MPAADGPVDEIGKTKTMSPEEMSNKFRRAAAEMQKKADSEEETVRTGGGQRQAGASPQKPSRKRAGRKPSEADKKNAENDDVSTPV